MPELATGSGPTISVLLRSGSPATIAGFIVSIVVDSFQSHPWRAFAHVGKKVGKVIKPTFTNYNPSSSPIFPLFFVGIVASRFHALPSSVSFCSRIGCCVSVFKIRGVNFPPTTTAGGMATNKIRAKGYGLLSAITKAMPIDMAVLRSVRDIQNEQSAKTLVGKIIEAHDG